MHPKDILDHQYYNQEFRLLVPKILVQKLHDRHSGMLLNLMAQHTELPFHLAEKEDHHCKYQFKDKPRNYLAEYKFRLIVLQFLYYRNQRPILQLFL